MLEGRYDKARANLREEFTFTQDAGDEYRLNSAGRSLASLEFASGNIELATELCEAAIERAQLIEGGDFLGFALCDYACLLLLRNDVERARDLARRALTSKLDSEEPSHFAIDHLAVVTVVCGRPKIASRLSGFYQAWSAGFCSSYLHHATQYNSLSILSEATGRNAVVRRSKAVVAASNFVFARDELGRNKRFRAPFAAWHAEFEAG